MTLFQEKVLNAHGLRRNAEVEELSSSPQIDDAVKTIQTIFTRIRPEEEDGAIQLAFAIRQSGEIVKFSRSYAYSSSIATYVPKADRTKLADILYRDDGNILLSALALRGEQEGFDIWLPRDRKTYAIKFVPPSEEA